MSKGYIRVKSLIECLNEACEKHDVSENDRVIMAEILGDNCSFGSKDLPNGTLKLTVRSDDPNETMDLEIYIFVKEETEE